MHAKPLIILLVMFLLCIFNDDASIFNTIRDSVFTGRHLTALTALTAHASNKLKSNANQLDPRNSFQAFKDDTFSGLLSKAIHSFQKDKERIFEVHANDCYYYEESSHGILALKGILQTTIYSEIKLYRDYLTFSNIIIKKSEHGEFSTARSMIIKLNTKYERDEIMTVDLVKISALFFRMEPRPKVIIKWPDPNDWSGPRKTAKRKTFGSKIMRLYHQTAPDAATKILLSTSMKSGSKGMFGGGIYFAETTADTFRKALHRGIMIEAMVFVGNEKVVPSADASFRNINFESLHDEGFDSVNAPYGAGHGNPERVVYKEDQVLVTQLYAV